jgi:adenosylmethionine-8-amino-7-oxononanoate aminotransferase
MDPAAKSPALIPTTTRPLPLAVAAKGARIFDASGLDYIDASSGPLAVSVGHGHPKVLQALRDQFAAVGSEANELAMKFAHLYWAAQGRGGKHRFASSSLSLPPGFLEELRRLCDANDVLWVCDEVMSGFGRTGTPASIGRFRSATPSPTRPWPARPASPPSRYLRKSTSCRG